MHDFILKFYSLDIPDVLKMGEQERQAYENHQTQLHREASLYESTYVLGKTEGKEEGIEEGVTKGILITAKNMKQANIEVKLIAQVTGLSIEQVDGL